MSSCALRKRPAVINAGCETRHPAGEKAHRLLPATSPMPHSLLSTFDLVFEWGSGGGPCPPLLSFRIRSRSHTDARCPMSCAVVGGVDPGCLGVVLCLCAVGIGGRRVVSDALCHCHWRGAGSCGRDNVSLCRGALLGGLILLGASGVSVSCGLAGGIWFGWCVVCLCHVEYWGTRPVGWVWWHCAVEIGGGVSFWVRSGVAVPWGLMGSVSCSVVLGVAVSCHVASCRVCCDVSCRDTSCC